MYLTYEEYVNYGGTLEETAFNQLEFEARSQVDWWTFNRLQNETEYPEAVKRCVFKLISLIQQQQQAMVIDGQNDVSGKQAGIASESNDGVSTSYNTLSAKEAVDSIKEEIPTVIQMFLQGVRNSLGHKLLYRGVYSNE